MSVQRRVRGIGSRGDLRDRAYERHVDGRDQRILCRQAVGPVKESRAQQRLVRQAFDRIFFEPQWLRRTVEIVGDGDRPFDLSLLTRIVADLGHLGDREARRHALDDAVGEVGVTQLSERVVADVKHPLGEVALRCHREVPREEQLRAVERHPARLLIVLDLGDDAVDVRAPRLVEREIARRSRAVVAVRGELRAGRDSYAAGVFHVPQRDQVAMSFGKVDRRTQEEDPLVGCGPRVHVELGPEWPALSRRRVDHQDRRVRFQVPADVGDLVPRVVRPADARSGHALRAPRPMQVEPRHEGQDLGPRREPVVAIPLGRVDRLTDDAARHLGQLEIDALPRRRGWVGACEVVVGERQQAERLIGLVARAAK